MNLKSQQAQKFEIQTNDFHSQKPFEIRTKKFGFHMVGTKAIAKALPFEKLDRFKSELQKVLVSNGFNIVLHWHKHILLGEYCNYC